MKRLLLATALLAVTAGIAPAKDLLTSGYWTTYVFPAGKDGPPLCGMHTKLTNRLGVESASVLVKFQKGGDHLFVQLFKLSWRFRTANKPVKMLVRFDDGAPHEVTGQSNISQYDDGSASSYVQFGIMPDYSNGFLRDFAEANRMSIQFVEGNEPVWTSSLIGSRSVAKTFADCVIYMGGVQRSPEASTPPFTDKPGTQPFKDKPTQPFGDAKPAVVDDGGI